jgi:hypothetical protein
VQNATNMLRKIPLIDLHRQMALEENYASLE